MAYFTDAQYRTKLFYEEIGEGIPFLLIHGWAIDHRFLEDAMEPAFSLASKSFRRIYVDVPGMGVSEPGLVKNGDGIVEVLMHLMDALSPGEKFYVGGNSFGAAVSRAMTAKYPDRLLGAVLLVPATSLSVRLPVKEGGFRRDEAFLATLPEKERDAFCAMNVNLTAPAFERYQKGVYPSVQINENNEFMHHVLRGSFSFDIDKALQKHPFKEPTLILTAKYDQAVGYEAQFTWLSDYPQSTYMVIDNAGHNVHVDQPECFVYAVAGWLRMLFQDRQD
ncbi:MAG: alpha/beta hydrolase [Lachnospiraceae bacterium]|nr:alpha/beta hydrolase [Lachnospiraceae bacterium]